MAKGQLEALSAPAATQRAPMPRRWAVWDVVLTAYRRHLWWMLALTVVIVAILVLAYGGYFLGWDWTGFKGNTFWDWLSLLITPVTIASVSIVFSIRQGRASVEAGERLRQDAMLEAYFDHMTHLLMEDRLNEAPHGSPVHAVARARTIATLRRASETHRAAIIRFLDESGLLAGNPPIVDLREFERPSGGSPEPA